jgi:ABC-2 type transport system permease protein
MKRYFKLYQLLLINNFNRIMMYKAGFITWSLVHIGWFIFNVAFFQLIFRHIDSIGGWSKGQIFIIQGFYFWLQLIIWGVVYANLYDFPSKINRGQIDLVLTKPVNHQFLLSFQFFSPNHFTNFLLGLILFIYGFNLLGATPSIFVIFLSIIAFITISIAIYAGYFITVCFAFYFERLNNIVYFYPAFREFGKFPLNVYPGWLSLILATIIPMALATTLPSQILFGQINLYFLLIAFLISCLSLIISHWFFRHSLKHYSSAN